MYHFVDDAQYLKDIRRFCSEEIFEPLVAALKEQGISTQFTRL